MSTTVRIRDHLLKSIRSRALATRKDLEQTVNDVLEEKLELSKPKSMVSPPLIAPKRGKYFPSHDLKSRMEEGRD